MQEKVKLNNGLSKFKESLNKNALIRLGFYIFTLIAIVLKGALFLGFSLNQNLYTLNFGLGYRQASYFINYYIAFAAIFVSICFLFKNKGKFFSLIIVDLFITLITVMDIWYFRGFQTVPSVMLLKQTANLDNLGDSIFSMASPYDLLFFVDFIILIIAFIIFRKSFKNCKSNWKGTLIVLLVSICYIGYVPFNVNVLKRENVKNSYLFSNYDPTNTVEYFSPIGYHIFDIYNVYKNSKPYKMTADDEAKIKEYYDFKNENLPDNEFKGMFKGKNLIVIQVESLEDFVINKKVDGQEITPNINKLLNNSIYLPNIFEQVNEGTSSDSDLMVNTSMLPLRQGSTFFRNPATTYNSLPNILEKDGYSTIAIHSDKGSFWNYAQGLNGIGFDKFVDYYSFDRDENIGLGLSDGSYFRQIEPMIKELKQPFYAFTVTLTSHGPFDLPKEYRELKLSPELDDNVLGGYFQSIHYTDAKIGMFIESLKKDGLLDNTVIAIEGDHPESWWLDNGNHTVPLIIYNPSIKTPVKDDVYGGQIDIMPTLLYLLGVDNNVYQNTALGRNLLNTKRSYAVLTDKTIKGELTDKEKEIVGNVLDLSDKMIRADYFKDKIPNDNSKNN